MVQDAAAPRPRILFVDDEPAILAGFGRMLRGHAQEWDLAYAEGGRAGIESAFANGFDAVVTDVMMPGVDGFQLLDTLRRDPRTADVPIVMVTGNDDERFKERALELGATDLLSKPVRRPKMVARVRNVLKMKEYQDSLRSQNAWLEACVAERTRDLADSRLDVIWSLARSAQQRDEITGNHVIRVGLYAGQVAREMSLDEAFVAQITLAAPLHDIGKIGIPDAVLMKSGLLDEGERQTMQQHCAIGASILDPGHADPLLHTEWRAKAIGLHGPRPANAVLAMATDVALHHHERWDGTGYPDALATEAIPMAARITAVVDVFDALRSYRHYKPPFDDATTLSIMTAGVGSQFDPRVWDAFLRCRPAILRMQERFGGLDAVA